MMKMKFANRLAAIAASLLCVFGMVIAVLLLIEAVKSDPFDWYRFIPAVLYILCFLAIVGYAMDSLIPSKIMFNSVLLTYGLVVLFTGIIYPPVYPHGMKTLFIVLSALIIVGLGMFTWIWKEVKKAKIILTFAYVFELFAAIAGLVVMTGNPMAGTYTTIDRLALFIRPILLSSIAVCYLVRVYEKFLLEKKD